MKLKAHCAAPLSSGPTSCLPGVRSKNSQVTSQTSGKSLTIISMSTCWAVGDRNEKSPKLSLILKKAEQPQGRQTPGAPAPDHLSASAAVSPLAQTSPGLGHRVLSLQPCEGQVQGNQ